MNRNPVVVRIVRKADSRMPFGLDTQELLSGYLSPQLHKNLRQLPSARKRKVQP